MREAERIAAASAIVPLPAQISSDGHEIWSWGVALSKETQRRAKMRELRKQIATVDCGGCELWMTRQCPKESNVNGRKYGPSMYGAICSLYSEKQHTADSRQKRRDELAILEASK